MRERVIEAHLRDGVKRLGGIAYKFTSPGNTGVPDRLVLFPGGRLAFVELKAPGGRLSRMQERQIERIRGLGFRVSVLSSREEVDLFLSCWKEAMPDDVQTTPVSAVLH